MEVDVLRMPFIVLGIPEGRFRASIGPRSFKPSPLPNDGRRSQNKPPHGKARRGEAKGSSCRGIDVSLARQSAGAGPNWA